ncbi:MAG: hypothetical protein A2V88_00775 [Elusimicrobia bacterium RBG_16_66_12]|nr:MAG: hypothetical protein A2V88_00775 [Elusimicrobia bacterium RBG_16_66_12]
MSPRDLEWTGIDRGTCRGCGVAVIFVRDAMGRTQILDARAHPIYAIDRDDDEGKRAVRLPNAFLSHFVTCPKASEFSKEK